MPLANEMRPPRIAKVDFYLSASMAKMKTLNKTVNCFTLNKLQFSLKMVGKESLNLKNKRSD